MKKFFLNLLLVTILFCYGLPALTYELPRWQFYPVKVFVESHPKKAIVMKAFKEWETQTNLAKFYYVDTDRKIPKIIVRFEDSNKFSIESGHSNAVGVTYSYTPGGFYATANIKMYLYYPGTNIPLPDDELYATALHEIGHALGLKHSSNNTDIMYSHLNTARHLTTNDLSQFYKIYK